MDQTDPCWASLVTLLEDLPPLKLDHAKGVLVPSQSAGGKQEQQKMHAYELWTSTFARKAIGKKDPTPVTPENMPQVVGRMEKSHFYRITRALLFREFKEETYEAYKKQVDHALPAQEQPKNQKEKFREGLTDSDSTEDHQVQTEAAKDPISRSGSDTRKNTSPDPSGSRFKRAIKAELRVRKQAESRADRIWTEFKELYDIVSDAELRERKRRHLPASRPLDTKSQAYDPTFPFWTVADYLFMPQSVYWPKREDVDEGRLYLHEPYQERVAELLEGDRGFCVVVGSSDAGKTALAIGIALQWQGEANRQRLKSPIAYYLRVHSDYNRPSGLQWYMHLARSLSGPRLLIIDDCHLALDAVNSFLEQWITHPIEGARVLLTSRPPAGRGDGYDGDILADICEMHKNVVVHIKAEEVFRHIAGSYGVTLDGDGHARGQKVARSTAEQPGRSRPFQLRPEVESVCRQSLSAANYLFKSWNALSGHLDMLTPDFFMKGLWPRYARIQKESFGLLGELCCLRWREIPIDPKYLDLSSAERVRPLRRERLICEDSNAPAAMLQIDLHPEIAGLIFQASIGNGTRPTEAAKVENATFDALRKYLSTSPANSLGVYRLLASKGADPLYGRLLRDYSLQRAAAECWRDSKPGPAVAYLLAMSRRVGTTEAKELWKRYVIETEVSFDRWEQIVGGHLEGRERVPVTMLYRLLCDVDPTGKAGLVHWLTGERFVDLAGDVKSFGYFTKLLDLARTLKRSNEVQRQMVGAFFAQDDSKLLSVQIAAMSPRTLHRLIDKLRRLGQTAALRNIMGMMDEAGWDSKVARAKPKTKRALESTRDRFSRPVLASNTVLTEMMAEVCVIAESRGRGKAPIGGKPLTGSIPAGRGISCMLGAWRRQEIRTSCCLVANGGGGRVRCGSTRSKPSPIVG